MRKETNSNCGLCLQVSFMLFSTVNINDYIIRFLQGGTLLVPVIFFFSINLATFFFLQGCTVGDKAVEVCMGSQLKKNKTKGELQSPAWGAKCSCPANEILKWTIMPP